MAIATRLLGVLIAMVAANYLWQSLNHHDWSTAFERSFFQAIALLCAWHAVGFIKQHSVATQEEAGDVPKRLV